MFSAGGFLHGVSIPLTDFGAVSSSEFSPSNKAKTSGLDGS
jgi:hypothetical protein